MGDGFAPAERIVDILSEVRVQPTGPQDAGALGELPSAEDALDEWLFIHILIAAQGGMGGVV